MVWKTTFVVPNKEVVKGELESFFAKRGLAPVSMRFFERLFNSDGTGKQFLPACLIRQLFNSFNSWVRSKDFPCDFASKDMVTFNKYLEALCTGTAFIGIFVPYDLENRLDVLAAVHKSFCEMVDSRR